MDFELEFLVALKKISEDLSASHRRKIEAILKKHNLLEEK